MQYLAGNYDVAVIGAGHAGCEAALASARMGCSVILFSINLDSIANMPCNPSIGGTAKGHLVREIDALGGQMGKSADATFIQSRILNKGKGPAVYSLRAQCDRRRYQIFMKQTLEKQERLSIRQAEIVEILSENGHVTGVVTHTGAVFHCKTVVIATGTYLKGKIIIGDVSYEGGPDGLFPARKLTESLIKHGIEMRRFKTGTPARIHRASVHFEEMEEQKGDDVITPFSFETEETGKNQVPCFLTYTNEKTHEIIRENLNRSPLYSGQIEGIGPRYCPSIEDKVVRFKDKSRHQLFIEPMGMETEELYVQGLSTSMPEDVQIQILRSIKGLEDAEMMRTAYAIEYDCVNPQELTLSLEFKKVKGLFGCGQFNGSSGYEEAAAQGLVAGINAANCAQNKPPFILDRTESYIGTLIDDLVTKGTNEPYRMMTSRSEYRLLLRQDNADIRLTPKGRQLGLISEERYQKFIEKQRMIKDEIQRFEKTIISPTGELNQFLTEHESANVVTGIRLAELMRRPELNYEILKPVDKDRPPLPLAVCEEVEIQIKYEGYIKRQVAQVAQQKKLEIKKLPKDINYDDILGLRIEAKQKLNKVKPESIGQASRISGVSPADISVLLIYLETRNRGK